MPTPRNEINNSIHLVGWPYTLVAGKCKNFARYTSWRSAVEPKFKANNWLWKKHVGNEYDAFAIECVKLADFPSSGTSVIQQKLNEDISPAHKAVNKLLINCFNKVRESQNKQ